MFINPEENSKDPGLKTNKNFKKLKTADIDNIKISQLKLKENFPKDNNIINLAKRTDSFGKEISKLNKKHKVSFIDQVSSQKNIAHIIYIEGQYSSINSKKKFNEYSDIIRKQKTKDTNQKDDKKNKEDVYVIKRPRKSRYKVIKNDEPVEQQCECRCIIY